MKEFEPALVVVFFIAWSAIMGSFLHFWWRVVPEALRRWADEEGFEILSRKHAGFLDWFAFPSRNGLIYRVRVLDRSGEEREGLVQVGNEVWFARSADRCRVEVRWVPGCDAIGRFRKWLDPGLGEGTGQSVVLAGKLGTRRLVLGFAAADLVLALLVLLFELMLLVGVALGVRRLMGLNPSPDRPIDDLTVAAGFLAMFVLYLPALIGLSLGGIGLIRRKPWGYTCHKFGAIALAVSIFGIVYTIPAYLVAMQPEFKAYCLGKQETPGKAGDLGDLI